MISTIQIRNFQSLKNISLELGLFTVIVGDSSSGKSALVRALEALVSNVRGSQFVTVGQSFSSISADSQEWKITLERGDGHGVYRIVDKRSGLEREYTKLGGDVPEDVTKLLRVSPLEQGVSLNFAGQHDKPFLLDASGQVVARTLGDLTNVSIILGAVREANRRRTTTNSTLKIRDQDLKQLQEQLPRFATLSSRRKSIESAKMLVDKARALSLKTTYLKKLISEIEHLQVVVSSQTVLQLPDLEKVEDYYMKFLNYRELIKDIQSLQTSITKLLKTKEELDFVRVSLQKEHDSLLEEMKECPVCLRPLPQHIQNH